MDVKLPLLPASPDALEPGEHDADIKDLRRELEKERRKSQTDVTDDSPQRRVSDPTNSERSRNDLLNPEIGRALKDVAKPGGFRRDHVRKAGTTTEYVAKSLMQVLQPHHITGYELSEAGDEDDPHGGVADGTSTNLTTAIITVKCCFGSAVLILPHGYKMAGLIGAPLCLIVVYLFMLAGMLHLIYCRQAVGRASRFQDLGRAWGSWGPKYISACVVLLCAGFNAIWCVTCQQNLSMIFTKATDPGDNVRLFAFLPIVSLLAFVRKLKFFSITNFLGIVCCGSTMLYLIFFAGHEIASEGLKPDDEYWLFNTENGDTFMWLGSCGYIFELITGILPIYEAAADKESMPKILIACTLCIITLYLGFGVLFYAAFGNLETKDLATLNLPKGSIVGHFFPLLFAMVGIVTMPINFFIFFQAYEPSLRWSDHDTGKFWMKNFLRFLIVCSIYGLTWLGGSQLQNFLALVGGLLGANLSMVVPAALHLSICKPTGLVKLLDYALFAAGWALMILSTYQSITTWGKGES